MFVIGVSGKARHGKDAICARLAERWQFTVIPFALALKEEVLVRLPRTLHALHDLNHMAEEDMRCACAGDFLRRDVFERKPVGVRELLQEYGTEVRRADAPDYWINEWLRRAKLVPNGRVAVSDVRFVNEARAVHRYGVSGLLWRVTRPGMPDTGTHESETQLDGWNRWDAVIRNHGTLQELHDLVDCLVEDTF